MFVAAPNPDPRRSNWTAFCPSSRAHRTDPYPYKTRYVLIYPIYLGGPSRSPYTSFHPRSYCEVSDGPSPPVACYPNPSPESLALLKSESEVRVRGWESLILRVDISWSLRHLRFQLCTRNHSCWTHALGQGPWLKGPWLKSSQTSPAAPMTSKPTVQGARDAAQMWHITSNKTKHLPHNQHR